MSAPRLAEAQDWVPKLDLLVLVLRQHDDTCITEGPSCRPLSLLSSSALLPKYDHFPEYDHFPDTITFLPGAVWKSSGKTVGIVHSLASSLSRPRPTATCAPVPMVTTLGLARSPELAVSSTAAGVDCKLSRRPHHQGSLEGQNSSSGIRDTFVRHDRVPEATVESERRPTDPECSLEHPLRVDGAPDTKTPSPG